MHATRSMPIGSMPVSDCACTSVLVVNSHPGVIIFPGKGRELNVKAPDLAAVRSLCDWLMLMGLFDCRIFKQIVRNLNMSWLLSAMVGTSFLNHNSWGGLTRKLPADKTDFYFYPNQVDVELTNMVMFQFLFGETTRKYAFSLDILQSCDTGTITKSCCGEMYSSA